jgi:oxygen-dependent protoporphyrinogen oxidase
MNQAAAMPRIIVIGGGISGLATAYHVQTRLPQAEVVVLEARPRLGGTIWTERRDGFQVELGPNGFLSSKPSTFRLCHALGLGGHLEPAQPAAKRRFLFENQQLIELPSGLGRLVFSGLISWSALWRVLTERFRRAGPIPPDESVYDFLVRRGNVELAERFADPLVTGIFAGDARQLSLPAAFPRLSAAEREFGSVSRGLPKLLRRARAELAEVDPSVPRKPGLWTLKGGLRTLIEALAERLRTPPRLGVPVQRVIPERAAASGLGRWTVQFDGHEPLSADAVVLTTPAPRQAALVADFDEALADLMLHIPYASIAVVALGYRQEDVPPEVRDSFGYIAPQRTRRDLLGVQFCSSIFTERAPAGHVLLRALCGGWQRPESMTWEDDRLSLAARRELRFALGIGRPPMFMHICRWDPAIPQYTLGHLQRVADIEQRARQWPGLFLGGNAYHGVALNDCTENAERLAHQVASFLQGRAMEHPHG